VIEWAPPLSAPVVKVAVPVPFNVPVPIAVDPSRKLTVPTGIILSVRDTDAVNVTLTPADTLALEAASAVAVTAFATVCTSTADWLARFDASPP
jgi:hypothetical protein